MRIVASVLLVAVVGCWSSKPAELPAVTTTLEVTEIQPTEVAPAPWEVPSDSDTASLFRSFRTSDIRLLRVLALREIDAGDEIAPLIERFPECRVLRHGAWIDLSVYHDMGGTRVIAKNGKLVSGDTGSCIYHHTFFNTTSEAEWTDHSHSYSERIHRWSAPRNSLPAVAGLPAALMVSWQLDDR
jgi:hypothetical protein